MSELCRKGIEKFHRLWRRFRTNVIQDVAEDIQLCEFDCRKIKCVMGDWKKCERRLRSIAQTQEYT